MEEGTAAKSWVVCCPLFLSLLNEGIAGFEHFLESEPLCCYPKH